MAVMILTPALCNWLAFSAALAARAHGGGQKTKRQHAGSGVSATTSGTDTKVRTMFEDHCYKLGVAGNNSNAVPTHRAQACIHVCAARRQHTPWHRVQSAAGRAERP